MLNDSIPGEVIGIDPGKKGGVAYTAIDGIQAVPMPLIGKDIDGRILAQALNDIIPDLVVIEKVHAMPKQGVTSMFNFGKGYGQLIGICEALFLPYILVTPQAWKKKVLAGTSKDKHAAIQYCQQRYPSVSLIPPRGRVPHDGMADAVCLVEYGMSYLNETSTK